MEDQKLTIDEFTKEFPYGSLSEKEGEYIERIERFLTKFSESQHSLIFDLLDLQWVSFVQQLWFIWDKTGSLDVGKNHFAMARLQINGKLRSDHGLPDRNMRRQLLRLENDVLTVLENAEPHPV